MKHVLNELWAEKYGTKTVYKVQAKNGVLTFKTKKEALEWQQTINNKLLIEFYF